MALGFYSDSSADEELADGERHLLRVVVCEQRAHGRQRQQEKPHDDADAASAARSSVAALPLELKQQQTDAAERRHRAQDDVSKVARPTLRTNDVCNATMPRVKQYGDTKCAGAEIR